MLRKSRACTSLRIREYPRRGIEQAAEKSTRKPKNREKNRGVSDSVSQIVEFCPKSANFVRRQGINREFRGYLAKLLSTRWLDPVSGRCKKLTGNYQEILLTGAVTPSSETSTWTVEVFLR